MNRGRRPRPDSGRATTTSYPGRAEAHGLAPLTPQALKALLLCHFILRCGHLDTQPGLIAGARVQLNSFQDEPGHPKNAILVPGLLWG